ncbi:hypothetical protein HPP92_011330 [Vanilla planifolia]|uniref:Homeobox domain-containing protein n=1 Tax=Vanilla planifolia TaxID=51239 RepID=A0A835V032_VANPL|nr:hypothetical protein HPP92_011330 [Vanilla planifolia]
MKVEDHILMLQSTPTWPKFANGSFSKIHQDAQSIAGGRSYLFIKAESKAHDDVQDTNSNNAIIKGGTTNSSSRLECDTLSVADSAKEAVLQEEEKAEGVHSEEKQPRKRKRNIMNERQISLIENALLEEPEMHRNAPLLQLWSEKLCSQGSEITASQLKNWLNNRKARLARAAREARAPSEGENNYDSAGEELHMPGTMRGCTLQGDPIAEPRPPLVGTSSSTICPHREPGLAEESAMDDDREVAREGP